MSITQCRKIASISCLRKQLVGSMTTFLKGKQAFWFIDKSKFHQSIAFLPLGKGIFNKIFHLSYLPCCQLTGKGQFHFCVLVNSQPFNSFRYLLCSLQGLNYPRGSLQLCIYVYSFLAPLNIGNKLKKKIKAVCLKGVDHDKDVKL